MKWKGFLLALGVPFLGVCLLSQTADAGNLFDVRQGASFQIQVHQIEVPEILQDYRYLPLEVVLRPRPSAKRESPTFERTTKATAYVRGSTAIVANREPGGALWMAALANTIMNSYAKFQPWAFVRVVNGAPCCGFSYYF